MNYLIDLRINNEVDHLIHHIPLNNLHNVPLFIHETNRHIRRRKKSNLFNINHLFFKHFSRDHCRSKIHSRENDNRVKQQRSTKSESGLSSTPGQAILSVGFRPGLRRISSESDKTWQGFDRVVCSSGRIRRSESD